MANSYLSIHLHVVFSTKHRAPLLADAVQPRLFEYMAGALRNTGASPTAVGGFNDHVHLLFSCGASMVLQDLVKELKRGTNAWLKKESLAGPDFAWQRGYGAFSISRWDVTKVADYIRDQHAHHRKMTFEEEYRKLLKRHGIEFDERYLLD